MRGWLAKREKQRGKDIHKINSSALLLSPTTVRSVRTRQKYLEEYSPAWKHQKMLNRHNLEFSSRISTQAKVQSKNPTEN